MPSNISRLCFNPLHISGSIHWLFHSHAVTPEHIFQPIPDAEYVVVFVERLIAQRVRCRVITLERRSFRDNPTYLATYTRRWIRGIVCGVIDGSWSEMSWNGLTDRHTHTTTTVTLAAHARRGLTRYTYLCRLNFVSEGIESGVSECLDKCLPRHRQSLPPKPLS